MENETRKLNRKWAALGLSLALLGVVFGAALTANLEDPLGASAETLTQAALTASVSADLESPFKTVYQEVSPSVVGIKITTNMRMTQGRIRTESEFVGSGVCIGDGYVVTNYHVVTGGGALEPDDVVVVYQDQDYAATYVAGDQDSDIAVLKVEGLDAPGVKLGNSDALSIGDWALVIGNPLGEAFTNTLTVGVISGTDRTVSSGSRRIGSSTSGSLIQTSAQINSGNSGGGLFNIRGELVGITSSKMSSSGFYSGASIEGIGFAIPVNTITKIVDDLLEYGKVLTPRLGVGVTALPSTAEEPTADALPASVWVREVEAGSPAEVAGIQVDDLILEVAGQRVKTVEELQSVLADQAVGSFVDVVVYRLENLRFLGDEADLSKGETLTVSAEVKLLDAE